MAFLESNSLLANNQHGFRAKLSTETALLKVSNTMYENIEEKKISLLMLLDLSKAFDSVSHNILLDKCEKMKIDRFWFEDYLKNRIQSVCINNVVSTPRSVSFGVPQGSILGPLLFLIFVNDLSQYITNCELVQYADDTQIIISDILINLLDLVKRAEDLLLKSKLYFQTNGLMVNESKTQCIFIGSQQYIARIPEDITISFCGDNIVPSKCVKNLGVHFDQYMRFSTHIDVMSKKVTGTLLYINLNKNRYDITT